MAILRWSQDRQIDWHYIAPGKPMSALSLVTEPPPLDGALTWTVEMRKHRGVTTALAVAAHEIPQVAGDFAIVLSAGHSRTSALVLNLSAALGGVAGALAMLLFGSRVPFGVPYVLAFVDLDVGDNAPFEPNLEEAFALIG